VELLEISCNGSAAELVIHVMQVVGCRLAASRSASPGYCKHCLLLLLLLAQKMLATMMTRLCGCGTCASAAQPHWTTCPLT
jgi:hypothetical protein